MTGFNRYGYYQYGRHEFRPGKRERGAEYEDSGPSLEELFGTGVALKSADDGGIPWDFVADNSGDLAATSGLDELGKDVAFKTAREGNSLVGNLPSANSFDRMESEIEGIMFNDSRVSSSEATVSLDEYSPGRVNVGLDIQSTHTEIPNYVFPLEW